ncbi:MAG: glycosyltransferase [Deltaproteobacteria bacterium]|nr:glycosyltransferase [Deltaproteobacteria bacterium]
MSEPIGVAQVVHSLEVGGMERVAVQLAAGLPRHRYRPLIICLTIRGDYADWAQREGVEVLALGKREGKAPFLFRRLARFLKEKGVSLVHAHNSGPWFTGTLAALAGRIGPVVVTDHSRPYADRFRVRAIEWALSHAVTVVSVSEENRTRLSKHLWIPPERIRVIPNGVAPIADAPPDRLRALRDEFRIDDRSFVFLCVARYEAQKVWTCSSKPRICWPSAASTHAFSSSEKEVWKRICAGGRPIPL